MYLPQTSLNCIDSVNGGPPRIQQHDATLREWSTYPTKLRLSYISILQRRWDSLRWSFRKRRISIIYNPFRGSPFHSHSSQKRHWNVFHLYFPCIFLHIRKTFKLTFQTPSFRTQSLYSHTRARTLGHNLAQLSHAPEINRKTSFYSFKCGNRSSSSNIYYKIFHSRKQTLIRYHIRVRRLFRNLPNEMQMGRTFTNNLL